MMRIALTILLMMAGLPVMATCNGPSFLDRLTPDERAALEATVANTPYPTGLIFDATLGADSLVVVGTIHVHDPRLADVRARVASDIANADLLLVEASPTDAANLEQYLADNPEFMFLTDGPTLPELLDEALWTSLSEAASERQIPPFMAAKMQPWFLSISLAIAPCAMADMMAGKQGLDFMLMDDAEAADVPIQSLEHWSLVIDLMRADPIEEQIEVLALGLLPLEIQSEMFVAMFDSYLSGNIAEVWEASRLSLNYVPGLDPIVGNAMFDEVEKMLLVDRNHNWMPVIAEAMESVDKAVIAVGAAHLPGDDGILRLLEADGWTVTPRD